MALFLLPRHPIMWNLYKNLLNSIIIQEKKLNKTITNTKRQPASLKIGLGSYGRSWAC
jgi:hypothetical protein